MRKRTKQPGQHLAASGRIEADVGSADGAMDDGVFARGGALDLDTEGVEGLGQSADIALKQTP